MNECDWKKCVYKIRRTFARLYTNSTTDRQLLTAWWRIDTFCYAPYDLCHDSLSLFPPFLALCPNKNTHGIKVQRHTPTTTFCSLFWQQQFHLPNRDCFAQLDFKTMLTARNLMILIIMIIVTNGKYSTKNYAHIKREDLRKKKMEKGQKRERASKRAKHHKKGTTRALKY